MNEEHDNGSKRMLDNRKRVVFRKSRHMLSYCLTSLLHYRLSIFFFLLAHCLSILLPYRLIVLVSYLLPAPLR